MARRRVRSMVAVVGGVVATLVAGLLTAPPASAVAPPVITSISVSGTTVTAPGPVTLSYTATVDSPLTSGNAQYLDRVGRYHNVPLTTGASGSGTLTVRDGEANGTWQLVTLVLLSAAGEAFVCRSDNANPRCTDKRDLSPFDVVVSGSHEDFTAPLLTGVTVTPEVAAGGTLTTSWSVTEAHTVAAMSLRLQNARPEAKGDFIRLIPTPAELAAGTMRRQVPSSRYDGTYQLAEVYARDSLDNGAFFRPDGTVAFSGPTTGPTSHDVDFSAVKFEFSGSTQDIAPPVLTSLSRPSTTSTPGQALPFSYVASDATVVQSVVLTIDTPQGTIDKPSSPVPAGTSGAVTYVPPFIGTYTVARITLTDVHGNSIYYRPDGTTLNPVTGATGTHTIDFTKLDFTAFPSPVKSLSVNPRSGRVGVGWTVPGDQGRDVSGYRLVVNPGGRVITVPSTGDSFASTVVTGLTNGVRYTFTVTPQSTVGPGASTTTSGTPMMSENIWAAGDADGDGRNDLFARTEDGPVRFYRGAGYPWFKTPKTGDTPAGRRVFPSAKVGADAAYLTIDAADRLRAVKVSADGRELTWTVSGPGWGSMRFIDGTADFTGDGRADVVAVTSTGILKVYRGDGKGHFTSPTTVGSGWGSMLRVFVPGDVTGDRRADVMAIDAAGVLWIYPGNGRGGFTTKKRVGSGWAGMGAVFATRDLNGDGRADIGAVTAGGSLVSYLGRGNGSFLAGKEIGSGWNAFF